MNDIRTPVLAVGYLAALTVVMFALGAFDIPSAGRILVMVVPLGMLAAVSWSATRLRGITEIIVSGVVWSSFAVVAASLLVDWAAWEHLGLAALVSPLSGSVLLSHRGKQALPASEPATLRSAA